MSLPAFGVTGTATHTAPARTGYCPWRSEASMPRVGTESRNRIEQHMEKTMRQLPNRSALNATPVDGEKHLKLARIRKGDHFRVKGNDVPYVFEEAIIGPDGRKLVVDNKDKLWALDDCDFISRKAPVFKKMPDNAGIKIKGRVFGPKVADVQSARQVVRTGQVLVASVTPIQAALDQMAKRQARTVERTQ